MNRTLSALFSALEAVIVVAVGLVIPLAPLTVLWAAQYGFAPDWAGFWRLAADAWLLGHGDGHPGCARHRDGQGIRSRGRGGTVHADDRRARIRPHHCACSLVAPGNRIAETDHRLLGEIVAIVVFAAAVVRDRR